MLYQIQKAKGQSKRFIKTIFFEREKNESLGDVKPSYNLIKKRIDILFFYVGIRDKIDRREVFDSFCFIFVFIAFYWKQKKKTFRKVTNLDKNRMIDLSFGWYFELRE